MSRQASGVLQRQAHRVPGQRRALHELNIDIIYANSSQAKGRVERVNKTLQDRLVKELRLEGIDTMEQANEFLLEPTELAKDLQRKRVKVYDYPDGTIAIKHNGTELPYSVFDKVRQVRQADIVSNKRLSSVLQLVKEQQKVKSVERSKATFREVNPAAVSTE